MTRRALVLGASGGIGAAVAAELARRGVDVTARSRRHHGLDVTDPEAVECVMSALEGPFDLIFVAVGVLAPAGGTPEKSLQAIRGDTMARVMAVNAIGPALILRHVPRLLPRSGRGVAAVLSARVGSIGDNAMGGWYSYRASKAALNQILHTAAIEVARKRPDAVLLALHPGTVETAFTGAYPGHDKVAPEQAARNLLSVIDRCGPADSGRFFDWAGQPVPW